MDFKKKWFVALMFCCVISALLQAQTEPAYRIEDVTYDIEGSTREFPLTLAIPVDKNRVFTDLSRLDSYITDLAIQFSNQRIFDSSSIDTEYGVAGEDGLIPVFLTVHTKDTWNIIVLPYPNYNSNTGFQLKLKIKDYNFFGSMQVMNGDINYQIDTNKKTTLAANLDFGIPFKAWGYSFNWSNNLSVAFPQDEKPEFYANTGMNIAVPIGISLINFGIEQGLTVNDRNSDTRALYDEDPVYFTETLYTNLPVILYKFDYFGNLEWTPNASISTNLDFTGIQHPDLQGPVVSWGHSLGIGRVDWIGNFRSGLTANLGNTYSYNIHYGNEITKSITGDISIFDDFFDRLGLNSRVTGYYNFSDTVSTDSGPIIRGILDTRISSDTAFTLNIDLPIRLIRVNFMEMTGLRWTRFFGFEMQASPFFDMALTHDAVTGRYFDLDDGWYSGGLELIVYPMRMRSIYGRISAGFDLAEVINNGGQLGGISERDGKSIRELSVGIGLHY